MAYVPNNLTRVSPSSGGWSMYEVRYFSHGNNSPDYDNGNSTGTAYAIYDRYHPNGGSRTSTNGAKMIKVGIGSTDYNNWSDHGQGNPDTVQTSSTGLVSLLYAPNYISVFDFQKPTTASWIPTGPTVTQTRTTHTGIIPNATGFTIRNPSPGVFYEKTGVGKFKIKFLDQNEPGTYNLRVQWTTLGGTISDTQSIASGSGDLELEYTGTAPSNTPVYGPVTLQIDQAITINGQQYVANTDFKTFTYLETGPYTASFSPDFGLPGQSITVSIADTNPYPDSDTPTQFEQSPGTDLISMPMTAANYYSNTVVGAFTSQHGLYKIYNGSTVLATANYDTNYVAPSTTSNGGGRPDRYPLIMTNLFNRNRSIYSIGMTHKDTWDLFL